MTRQLVRDESGMTLALAVMMVVLIGVLGAGLLTFVNTDLNTVVEANRGQQAFEMADAGVRAAKAQLDNDSDYTRYNSTDADKVDYDWAESKGGKTLTMDQGSANGSANVQIRYGLPSSDLYRVISTGCYPSGCTGAKRKIEAVFKVDGGVAIPPVSFSRNNIDLNGTVAASNMSLFAMGNVTKTGGSGSFTGNDLYFKKWAATADSYSYPNIYNSTARGNDKAAVGAIGTVDSWYTSQGAPVFSGSSSCTTGTGDLATGVGIKMVADWSAGASVCPTASRRISFPFNTSTTQQAADIASLRQRAQDLEAATGYDYYRNGSCSGSYCTISSWPANSDYQTVVFYDFPSYSTGNSVSYSAADPTAKGVIVVVNGDFSMSGSGAIFKGGIVTYTNPASATMGTATLTGSSSLSGYVNATGTLKIAGTPDAGSVPALNSLAAFDGSPTMISWRELYQ